MSTQLQPPKQRAKHSSHQSGRCAPKPRPSCQSTEPQNAPQNTPVWRLWPSRFPVSADSKDVGFHLPRGAWRGTGDLPVSAFQGLLTVASVDPRAAAAFLFNNRRASIRVSLGLTLGVCSLDLQPCPQKVFRPPWHPPQPSSQEVGQEP